ncbi:glycosyltransferase [Parablautia intestinalis]|uniref:Glycosyltransferase n=1 Tax=Parablautia intestinalis TaxID=2320100 RepID=A0A3A9AF63_9FIRM|nr:glycosyltransferase [Parablautia intestinalis]RKI90300.1 glycosyltransferase [Parablautia intestinalis]
MNRILWICNIMLPAIGQEINLPYSNREGWLSGIFEKVQKKEAPFTLGVCFPLGGAQIRQLKEKKFSVQGIVCYAFEENLDTPEIYDAGLENVLQKVIADFSPDIVHIFGTEFPHALAAVRAFGKPERTLIGIQGLCSEIAKVYMAGLPERASQKVTFRDWLKRDSIRQQQEKFIRRGENEKKAMLGCGNITGRTAFDKEGSAKINPYARYYFMNETMRREFYTGKWSPETCEKHSILLGQGDYPLKGMHFVLEAAALLVKKYPDLKLYVTGNSILGHGTLKEKIKLSAYGKYLLTLIKRYDLEDKVVMTGKRSAQEMKQQFLNSSVFVCASVLENSPNTVGEAQLLGVPVVASKAGGIPDMVKDGVSGLLFSVGNVKELADKIEAVWDDNVREDGLCLSERLCQGERKQAGFVHDGERNYLRLLEIYEAIGEAEAKV